MEHRELRADLRAYRVWESCRGIALAMGLKSEAVDPKDLFPSLRALKVTEAAASEDIDADEGIAMASFQQLRRSYRA